jgi:hypothetical protein
VVDVLFKAYPMEPIPCRWRTVPFRKEAQEDLWIICRIVKLFWSWNIVFFFSRRRNIFNTPVEFSKYITTTTEGNSANLWNFLPGRWYQLLWGVPQSVRNLSSRIKRIATSVIKINNCMCKVNLGMFVSS